MKQFKNDILHWKDYDFTVINDKLEKCYKLIVNYINKKKGKNYSMNNRNLIKQHIDNLIN